MATSSCRASRVRPSTKFHLASEYFDRIHAALLVGCRRFAHRRSLALTWWSARWKTHASTRHADNSSPSPGSPGRGRRLSGWAWPDDAGVDSQQCYASAASVWSEVVPLAQTVWRLG